ncbi:MoaD/ThiS family protein [Aliikangiella sp. IMCC44653]
MAKLHFTPNLRRHIACDSIEFQADSLTTIFDFLSQQHPALASYLLTEQNLPRKHILICVNGQVVARKSYSQTPLDAQSEVYFMQALSGG